MGGRNGADARDLPPWRVRSESRKAKFASKILACPVVAARALRRPGFALRLRRGTFFADNENWLAKP